MTFNPPKNHPLNSAFPTAYTPSVATAPVAAYFRAPFRGSIRKLAIILGGAITTANLTLTVTNLTQNITVGTVTVPFAASAAGTIVTADDAGGFPTNVTDAQVNEDDVIVVTPSGSTGASIPAEISLEFRAN